MKKVPIYALVICLALSLSGCRKIENDESVSYSSQGNGTMQQITSEILSSGVTEEVLTQRPTQAEISQELTADKEIVVSGKLESDEYAAKIAQLQEILNEHRYNISLAVYSVDGGKALAYNTNAEIFGACTVKAAYTLYACKQMEAGNGDLQTPITYSEKHYEPGTGDMQYSSFGTVFTMETALYKSMSISDNVGYLMSVDFFGRDDYNTWIGELGCNSLKIKPTVWSLRTKANDLIKIWCQIYNYFETDTEYSRFLKSSCTNTAGNYATAALSGVDYSHKQGHNSTGDWLSLSDAGIVWKDSNPYIIAILTDAPGPNAYSTSEFSKIIDIVHNNLF